MNKPNRRVKLTTPELQPPPTAPEGQQAAWWRERVARLSRPALAEILDCHPEKVARVESMEAIPPDYRLACASVETGNLAWHWTPRRR